VQAGALGRPITSILVPDLKQPGDHVGRQVEIPGALWVGRQTAVERETLYKCTIRDFSFAHLFPGGFVPEKAWQVQEMGVSGSGSLEGWTTRAATSSGSGIKNSEFLKYFYKTYPELKIEDLAPQRHGAGRRVLLFCSIDTLKTAVLFY